MSTRLYARNGQPPRRAQEPEHNIFTLRNILLGLLVVVVLFGGTMLVVGWANGSDTTSKASHPVAQKTQAAPSVAPSKSEKPVGTKDQQAAIEKAEYYLDFQPMSKKGLIRQLVFDKFERADAKFAVNHIQVNWNQQAKLLAENLLDVTAYNHAGLVQQLRTYGSFTESQAEYGATQALKG